MINKALYDWWKIKPPCENIENPHCHTECPYYGECFPNYDEEDEREREENEQWGRA